MYILFYFLYLLICFIITSIGILYKKSLLPSSFYPFIEWFTWLSSLYGFYILIIWLSCLHIIFNERVSQLNIWNLNLLCVIKVFGNNQTKVRNTWKQCFFIKFRTRNFPVRLIIACMLIFGKKEYYIMQDKYFCISPFK